MQRQSVSDRTSLPIGGDHDDPTQGLQTFGQSGETGRVDTVVIGGQNQQKGLGGKEWVENGVWGDGSTGPVEGLPQNLQVMPDFFQKSPLDIGPERQAELTRFGGGNGSPIA
jgi:hypothetical protein